MYALGAYAERRVGSNPTRGTKNTEMVKLVDTASSKGVIFGYVGSSPTFGTKKNKKRVLKDVWVQFPPSAQKKLNLNYFFN